MKAENIIYQVTQDIAEIKNVVIDIAYSGGEDEQGNEVLEFECALVEAEWNMHLSEEEIEEANDLLECGFEEQVIVFLKEAYANTNIRFDVGEIKHNPMSPLYDATAE